MDVNLFSVFPVSERQSKWFAKVLTGECDRPPRGEMVAETEEWRSKIKEICYKPMLVPVDDHLKFLKQEMKAGCERAMKRKEKKASANHKDQERGL